MKNSQKGIINIFILIAVLTVLLGASVYTYIDYHKLQPQTSIVQNNVSAKTDNVPGYSE